MTVEAQPKHTRRFAQDRLPWVVVVVFLAVFLVTLNHWFTVSSLPLTANVARWDTEPFLHQPLLFLVTLPFRWLPVPWIPMALNGFTAACAALTLGFLARSVALLPMDRLPKLRPLLVSKRLLLVQPDAWVPPVLAVVACGLQLSYWEHATSATGEMLDLLLIAYIVRCLLEYRIDPRQGWLDRIALVCGLGMANNWAMICFSPIVVVALVWTAGLPLFNVRTVLRLVLFSAAGLSVYLIVPLVYWFGGDTGMSFWKLFKAQPGWQKSIIALLAKGVVWPHRIVALLLASLSLVPLLVMSIRWASRSGETGDASRRIRDFIVQTSHAFLLLLCLCAAFDPPFSPRQILSKEFGFSLPLLPFYFLSSLCVGYYTAYFLLLYRARHHEHASQRHSKHPTARQWAPKLVYGLLGISLLGLVLKNVPIIRAMNHAYSRDYGDLVVKSLPPEGGIVLSDDPFRLHAVQAALDRLGISDRYAFAAPSALPSPDYRQRLQRRWPGVWPQQPAANEPPPGGALNSGTNVLANALATLNLLKTLARSNSLFYLHPGYGYLFESFYLRPRGLVYEMKTYPTNQFNEPALTPVELTRQERFWGESDKAVLAPLREVVSVDADRQPDLRSRLLKRAHLKVAPPPTATAVANYCSSALNTWGVSLQRNGHLPEAKRRFEEAWELNRANLPAGINRQCNSNLLAGHSMQLDRAGTTEAILGKYRKWGRAIEENGPFDDPMACHHLAGFYGENRLFRQAGLQLERVEALAPGDRSTRFTLAELYRIMGLPEKTLQVIAAIRAESSSHKLNDDEAIELEFMEAKASYAVTNRAKAEHILQAFAASRATDTNVAQRAVETLLAYRSFSTALPILNRSLQLNPDDATSLINQGFVYLQLGAFSNAIPPLTRALSITNYPAARFNRAIANLRAQNLDAAEADYLELQQAFPRGYQFAFGLAEIAFQRKDTNAAVRHYQAYLDTAPAESDEANFVRNRLKALQPGASPGK